MARRSRHLPHEVGLEARELVLVDESAVQEIGKLVEAVHDMALSAGVLARRTGSLRLTQSEKHGRHGSTQDFWCLQSVEQVQLNRASCLLYTSDAADE